MRLLPLVSIAIPAYKPDFFEAALRSALAQDYPSLEIVITDDCRGGGIRKIVDRLSASTDIKIHYIYNEPQLGGLSNLTRCMEESSGEYIKFLNDDDLLEPSCVSRMVAVLQDESGISLVTSRRKLIDAAGERLPDILETCLLFNEDVRLSGADMISLLAEERINFIGEPSTVMFRRAQLIDKTPDICALNGVVIRAVNDLALYVNLLLQGDLAYIQESLSSFRRHKNQRQNWSDMAELARRGHENFTRQIQLLGLYRPQLAGTVRRSPLYGEVKPAAFGMRALLKDNRRRVGLEDSARHVKFDGEGVQVLVENFPKYIKGKSPVGIIVHAYYPDVLKKIIDYLLLLQAPIHLYVSCVSESQELVRDCLVASTLDYSLFLVENRGRDILPFLRLLPYLRRDGIAVFLKLHTKKSLHLEDLDSGQLWGEMIYESLLSPSSFQAAVDILEKGQEIPLLGPERFRLPIAQYLKGNNKSHLQLLAERANLSMDQILSGEFFAGSMFFSRTESLEGLLSLDLRSDDFEPEQGQVDGTLAHALERFFLVFVEKKMQLSRTVLYQSWLASRRLSGSDTRGLSARLANWPCHANILVIIDDIYVGNGLVARSLFSLSEQLYAAAAVVVFSNNTAEDIEPADNLLWLSRSENFYEQLNEVLPQIQADWFYLLRAGDRLDPHALLLLAERVVEQPSMQCCYSDEDGLINAQGDSDEPVFKPDLNLDMLRSYPYVGRALAFQCQAFLELGGFQSEFQNLAPLDLLFRLLETHGLTCVGHIAEVLVHQHEHLGQWLLENGVVTQVASVVSAHLKRLGVPHSITPGALRMINRVTYCFAESPLVSIVIPSKNQLGMLRRCVETLLEKTKYKNYEILIVDNASDEADALKWLSEIEQLASNRLRLLRYPHVFNFSAINNFAVKHARGEYLVLLNNDTAVVEANWLDMLLNHARRPEVGIVGAKLHYPDGRIQHGGVVLGLRGVADHPYIGEPNSSKGYMQRLQIDQNYSVVTAACLMIRKSVYQEVGGMDEESFKVSFNDVDLCLKVSEAGYLNVWTPYATLLHEANVSQNLVDKSAHTAKVERFHGEQQAMYRKWLPKLARDSAYNKNLNLDGIGFALDRRTEIAWQPFVQRQRPYVLARAADPYGCGHYRVIKPFAAMSGAGIIDGADSHRLYSVVEMERISADSVIFQRQLLTPNFEAICNARSFSQAFRVFELDDYIVDLPLKSVHRSKMPKDVAKLLRRAVSLCDRFVVSTAPLAEALQDMHSDIRVVENRLPLDWWANAKAQAKRKVGHKPRVGWAGGSSHTGDLELLVDVVRELAHEVEWVFFGMCPEGLRPYIHEFHAGVHIEQYPEKLAGLNLDLALAPLEDNLFNRCKSNLRLLEYGICGFPVICSDNLCYRGELPVTRVKNRSQDWLQAIRMHLADLDATARDGDALCAAVRRDWMLEGEHLYSWRNAWLAN